MFLVLEIDRISEISLKNTALKPWYCSYEKGTWSIGWLIFAVRFVDTTFEEYSKTSYEWRTIK